MKDYLKALLTVSLVLPCCYTQTPLRLPVLPSQFSLHQELIDVNGKQLASSRELFDYDGKIARTDMVPPVNSDLGRAFGTRPVKIISDFNTGYRYVIDRWSRNCSMGPLPAHSWAVETDGSKTVHMRHTYDLFDKLRSPDNYIFKEVTVLRNISVNRWTKTSGLAEENLFMLKHDWSSIPEESQNPVSDIPVGLSINNFSHTGGLTSQLVYHIFDFYQGHMERGSFDMEDCFGYANEYKSLLFVMEGSYNDNVYGKHEQVYTAVTNAIAKHAQISALRVTDLYLLQTFPLHLDVLFILRESPAKLYNVETSVVEPTLEEAEDNLRAAVNKGFKITVPYKDGTRDVSVVTETLTDRRKWYKKTGPSQLASYTPGAMAGIGIGMLLFGAILGIGAAFVIHKRLNTAVPYSVTQ